ncbi:SAV_2336 N-terminal domain-related protein [Streptomyces sp. NRRL F-5123]|uniref:SAV_2336 N-terminal domain-related protein n=1 Tax=Streptomyces sp. NRRL F-5123 TaxID=1463856 RepID=UPI000ACA758E|nr:SAV_2336 N-terminal domain-related protein [Streptomyces sp. NRRL F-5123]
MDAEHETAGPPPQPPGRPPEPPAGTGPPGPADPVAELVGRLSGAGLAPGHDELADALWLARWSQPTAREPVPPPGPVDRPPTGGSSAGTPGDLPQVPADGSDGAGSRLAPPEDEPPGTLQLYPGGGDTGRARTGPAGLAVAVPEAPALPRLLELQAALRPLQRYHTPARPLRSVLDESATADRTALAGGLLLPVFRPVRRGNATMQLLMDASSSMYVWERMLRDLGGVFERLGAFHEVQVRYLHVGPEGSPAVSRHFDPEPAERRSAEQLGDPTGRRITLLVSDCVGPLWRSGQAHRLLHRLAAYGPVAVLQPLPTRLWARTRLPVSYGVLHRAEGPLPAAALRFSAGAGGFTTPPVGDALPVPVLPPTAQALGAWARLLAGTGAGEVPAAVGWVRSDQPASPGRPRRAAPAPGPLVETFRSSASPAASHLAVYLSAAPLFLPVMQIVQRTMLPLSGPAELAEVLLSGLVVRTDGDDHRWYEFAPGVRDELLQPLGRDEAALVLKHCSAYVEQRFGRGGPNFLAMAVNQLTDGPADPVADATVAAAARRAALAEGGTAGADGSQPFAEVAARVLERFVAPDGTDAPPASAGAAGGRPGTAGRTGDSAAALAEARELVAAFLAENLVQKLIDAVGLLRTATRQERRHATDPELWSEFAEQLIRLWRLRRSPSLLREAQQASEVAAAHPGSVRAREVRAWVLRASADDRTAVGDVRGALEQLRRADRELTAVCAAPGLDTSGVLRATLERVQVLESQWELSGDTALLEETVGMLEAFADAWPPAEPRPSELAMAHGRALLRLAGAAPDREREQVCAQQAAQSFAAALEELERAGAAASAGSGASGSAASAGSAGGSGGTEGAGPAPERVIRTLLALVDALLAAGGRLPEAQRHVDRALGLTRDRLQRASIFARAGRIRAARYAEGGPPGELEAAAGRFAEACRLTPRDRPEYSDLVAEWGAVLLDRSGLPGGETFVNTAVQVLRECRTETPESDPRLPWRLLMLGRALVLRYTAERDLVDLREAEWVLGRAAQPAVEPAQIARIAFELGQVHRLAHAYTGRAERLDLADDAYRRAAEAAAGAAAAAADPLPMVRLSAQAHHWRGAVNEAAHRRRAATDAYRSAAGWWRRLPDDGGEAGRQSAARLAALSNDV